MHGSDVYSVVYTILHMETQLSPQTNRLKQFWVPIFLEYDLIIVNNKFQMKKVSTAVLLHLQFDTHKCVVAL